MSGYHQNRTHHSRGDLALLAESPRRYEGVKILGTIEPDDDNDNLRIGTATHAIALQDILEIDRIVEIPREVLASNGAKNGGNWKAWAAGERVEVKLSTGETWVSEADPERPSKALLKSDQIAMAYKCSESIHRELGPLLSYGEAFTELEIYWDDIVPCRCKLDYAIESPDEVLVIDLKTAADITPRGFRSACWNNRYWLQDAHYSEGARRHFDKRVRFIFAAVEKKDPYRCFVYELPEMTKQRAADRRIELMNELKERLAAGDWSEPQEGIVTTLEELGELT